AGIREAFGRRCHNPTHFRGPNPFVAQSHFLHHLVEGLRAPEAETVGTVQVGVVGRNIGWGIIVGAEAIGMVADHIGTLTATGRSKFPQIFTLILVEAVMPVVTLPIVSHPASWS